MTESEQTANILYNLFETNEDETAAALNDLQSVDHITTGIQSSKALLASVEKNEEASLDNDDDDDGVSMTSELMIYGIWKNNSIGGLEIDFSDKGHVPDSNMSLELSIYVLPLSSTFRALALEMTVKVDPGLASAMFLTSNSFDHHQAETQSARKRKSDIALDNIIVQSKKGRRSGDLPPGLHRPVNFSRSSSILTTKLEQLNDYDSSSVSRRSSMDGINSQRILKRSASISHPDKQSRMLSREPSVVLYPNLHIPDSKTRGRSVTRPPEFNETSQTPSADNISSNGQTTKFSDKNKSVLQKIIMSTLGSMGLIRRLNTQNLDKKAQEEDDEYKMIYHIILKSSTFALRKRWDVEVVDVDDVRELVDVFARAFISGTGLDHERIGMKKVDD